MPAWLTENKPIGFLFSELSGVEHAIEAGPMLMRHGKSAIDMEKEGWKSQHSQRTQAARVDLENLRGPKIAAGLDREHNLYIVTINGRIRESVGATHQDLVRILRKYNIVSAMGFDPGGSVSLVVDDRMLNIPPYNQSYETNIYSAPPQPRAISNVIIGWQQRPSKKKRV
jgi:exopolysaccharide biosynthesis protein